jgi:hypothetical protein
LRVATQHFTGCYRYVPQHDSDEQQECMEITVDRVPGMPETATVGDVTPRSVRYDDGTQSWFVDPTDKGLVRAYREKRIQEDIDAGAYPLLAFYHDERGPL